MIFNEDSYTIIVEFGKVKEARTETYKVLNDINFGLSRGAFQIDSASHKIYFKYNIVFENEALSAETIKSSLFIPEIIIERNIEKFFDYLE